MTRRQYKSDNSLTAFGQFYLPYMANYVLVYAQYIHNLKDRLTLVNPRSKSRDKKSKRSPSPKHRYVEALTEI